MQIALLEARKFCPRGTFSFGTAVIFSIFSIILENYLWQSKWASSPQIFTFLNISRRLFSFLPQLLKQTLTGEVKDTMHLASSTFYSLQLVPQRSCIGENIQKVIYCLASQCRMSLCVWLQLPKQWNYRKWPRLIQCRCFHFKCNCHFISKTLLRRNDCLGNECLSRELKPQMGFLARMLAPGSNGRL